MPTLKELRAFRLRTGKTTYISPEGEEWFWSAAVYHDDDCCRWIGDKVVIYDCACRRDGCKSGLVKARN